MSGTLGDETNTSNVQINFSRVNAFTRQPSGGNPAGVVLDANMLSDDQMLGIAQKIGCSETAFVTPSRVADFKVRFFSPTVEVALCGHATIATFFVLGKKRLLKSPNTIIKVTQETNSGVFPVEVYFDQSTVERVMMEQRQPVFRKISVEKDEIATALGIDKKQLASGLPLQIVSTGLFSFPIGVRDLDVIGGLRPDFRRIAALCRKIEAGSIHVFTFETKEPGSSVHCRDFAPLFGVNEDPVTGTASGALCCYLVKNGFLQGEKFICEQGDFISRPGRVFVEIERNQKIIRTVKVGGSAILVEEGKMVI